MKSRVVDTRRLTPSTVFLRVERPEGFDFEAGQFAVVALETRDGLQKNALSIASPPDEDVLDFAVRGTGSPYKDAVAELDPGDEVRLDGPFGRFTVEDSDRPVVLLCGGIGITPFRSIIRDMEDDDRPVTLIYSNPTRDEIAFRDELDDLAQRNPDIGVVHTITRPKTDLPTQFEERRVDAEMLRQVGVLRHDADFYLCGPPAMVDDLHHLLSDLGVDGERIHEERFTGYE